MKVYLGDSVYVTNDGHHISLFTDNGLGPTNVIHLEPSVVKNFNTYVEAMWPTTEPAEQHQDKE